MPKIMAHRRAFYLYFKIKDIFENFPKVAL